MTSKFVVQLVSVNGPQDDPVESASTTVSSSTPNVCLLDTLTAFSRSETVWLREASSPSSAAAFAFKFLNFLITFICCLEYFLASAKRTHAKIQNIKMYVFIMCLTTQDRHYFTFK